jgi:hypothetical protein
MSTCTACGSDVTGMKFCQQCGTPVQLAVENKEAPSGSFCASCGHQAAPGERFCSNCGTQLNAGTGIPAQPAQAGFTQPGQYPQQQPYQQAQYGQPASYDSSQYSQYPQNPQQSYPQSQYGQPQYSQPQYGQPQYQQQAQPYGQPQYGQLQYQQPYGQPQYGQQYPQPGQMGYQPEPMMGQQPMVLRCPTCMAMSPIGTSTCPGCHTNLAGIVPTPAAMGMGQQQQGGLGGMLQGNGGNLAMGALGGAAAIIGGEMLLGGFERHHREEGGLGELGELGRDIGLF